MKRKGNCPNCRRGTLKHLGNNIYECTVCLRGSFIIKRNLKTEKFLNEIDLLLIRTKILKLKNMR